MVGWRPPIVLAIDVAVMTVAVAVMTAAAMIVSVTAVAVAIPASGPLPLEPLHGQPDDSNSRLHIRYLYRLDNLFPLLC